MRKILFSLSASIITTLAMGQGYQVKVSSNALPGMMYLTYHMGDNLNLQDSAITDADGKAKFKNEKLLPGGIYAIVFPGKRQSADFLMDSKSQDIKIEADTADLLHMKVSGSPAHTSFADYQQKVAEKAVLLNQEKQAFNNSRTHTDSTLHEAKYNQLTTELNQYRNNIISADNNSMMAVLLSAMKEPAQPVKVARTYQDSLENYNFYKSHYWDGVSFMDERIIRTPFFLPKLQRYYREVLPQAPDSIIKDIDYKLLLARNNPEMFKFLLNWLTDEYFNPKYMGQDAIFVHLFEKYHSKGLTPWLNEKQMETISRRAYMQMANQVGEFAANLEMLTPAGVPVKLYEVKAKNTVVLFWDPSCGHCKEELPHIDSIYRASWKANGVKIFAVLTEKDTAAWKNYIKEHNIEDWTHAYQTTEMEKAIADSKQAGFRQLYDVIVTPTLYLLDENKRIIAKKLSWLQLNDLMKVKMTSK
ncbi:MAG: redoxin domain-containing protein [Ferruginibacter sp.]